MRLTRPRNRRVSLEFGWCFGLACWVDTWWVDLRLVRILLPFCVLTIDLDGWEHRDCDWCGRRNRRFWFRSGVDWELSRPEENAVRAFLCPECAARVDRKSRRSKGEPMTAKDEWLERCDEIIDLIDEIENEHPRTWERGREFLADIRDKVRSVADGIDRYGEPTERQAAALDGWERGVRKWHPELRHDEG